MMTTQEKMATAVGEVLGERIKNTVEANLLAQQEKLALTFAKEKMRVAFISRDEQEIEACVNDVAVTLKANLVLIELTRSMSCNETIDPYLSVKLDASIKLIVNSLMSEVIQETKEEEEKIRKNLMYKKMIAEDSLADQL